MTLRLSEPQKQLLGNLAAGGSLRHEVHQRGLYRLTEAGRSRTVHPATVQSLIALGLLNKGLNGVVTLIPAGVTQGRG
jgi:hypothetical protein